MSSIAEMKAQLATIKARKVKSPAQGSTVSDEETSFLEGTANVLGAIPSGTVGFFSNISTSYKFHEAKRKGLI